MIKIVPKVETREVSESSSDDNDSDSSSEEIEQIQDFTSPMRFTTLKQKDEFQFRLKDFYVFDPVVLKSNFVPTTLKFRNNSKNV